MLPEHLGDGESVDRKYNYVQGDDIGSDGRGRRTVGFDWSVGRSHYELDETNRDGSTLLNGSTLGDERATFVGVVGGRSKHAAFVL
jgi:hypothetical protein